MEKKELIKQDLIKALKDKEELKLSTLRLLTAAIKNFEIEKGGAGYSASDEEVLSVVQKQVKQRQDSIEQFKAGNRPELVEKEQKELTILQSYLPEQMGEEEIKSIVEKAISDIGASGAADIGKVMGMLSGQLKGKADMSLVSKLVREKLG
jgi:uncharacterized protein YqeY